MAQRLLSSPEAEALVVGRSEVSSQLNLFRHSEKEPAIFIALGYIGVQWAWSYCEFLITQETINSYLTGS